MAWLTARGVYVAELYTPHSAVANSVHNTEDSTMAKQTRTTPVTETPIGEAQVYPTALDPNPVLPTEMLSAPVASETEDADDDRSSTKYAFHSLTEANACRDRVNG